MNPYKKELVRNKRVLDMPYLEVEAGWSTETAEDMASASPQQAYAQVPKLLHFQECSPPVGQSVHPAPDIDRENLSVVDDM